MSVLVSKRHKCTLQVILKTEELLKWTVNVCNNESVMPKRYRWCIQSQIISVTTEAAVKMSQANMVRPETPEDWMTRINYQRSARDCLIKLRVYVTVADMLFHLKESTATYWSKSIAEIAKLLKEWMKSDCEKFDKFQQESNDSHQVVCL